MDRHGAAAASRALRLLGNLVEDIPVTVGGRQVSLVTFKK